MNECTLNTDGCAHICTNTIGSYTCSCRTGYSLATDRHLCEGILLCDFKCCETM
ncbi:calcium-binding EGF-like domain-containing protein, partial [Salmonella enterica subsp. enterica serovar Kentucky]|uniref:calcium-binding EGF-like domain-containing protein n=1 Tax=Salmonella enterica TaxID=28901 RepID=UPI003F4B0BE3